MPAGKPRQNPGFAALSPEEQRRLNQMSPAELRAHNQGQRGGAAAPDTGGSPNINYRDPVSVSAEVARQGLAAGSDPTTRAAEGATQNILRGQGGAGSGTGFQHHNPIADALAERLLGEPTDAEALLRQFVGPGGTVGGAGGARPDPNDPYAPRPGAYQVINVGGGGNLGGAQGAGGGAAAGGGMVPDTVGNSTAFFAQKMKEFLNSGASDADIKAVIDAANADVNRGLQTSLWDLDAASQGAGRLGGDTWAGLQNQARSDAARQMSNVASQTRLNELQNRRGFYENLLGQVNARDIAAMQDATNRFGISTSASSAGAGNAEANALARRAQDLSALGMILENQRGNTNQLAGLGDRLSADQLASIGMAPNLAGINLSGLGAANQAAGNQVALRGAQIQGGVARAGLNLQADMFNAQQQQQQINDYLRTVLGLGGLGGTSHTEGSNVVPGINVSPTGAAIQGGIGAGLGAYGYGRGG